MKGISIYRATFLLLFVIMLVLALYYGREFLVPLAFGVLLAMLLLPIARKLEDWGIGRVPSIFLCLLLLLLLISGIGAIITFQSVSFSKDLPQMQEKLSSLIDTTQQWIQQQFGVSPQKQIDLVKKGVSSLSQSGSNFLTTFAKGMLGSLTSFALVLIYVFFFLWQRDKYEDFFLQLARQENRSETREMLQQMTKVASEYLGGRLLSMGLLAILYAVGFLIIGLKNAILLALIAVIPTIIPYVGPLIGGFFPLAMALVSQSAGMALPVLIVLILAQALDNYLIEPFVLGSNLNVSPFITIVSIVIGELIWGVSGMILFIPLFAIIKIFCDHLPALHPVAFLLGDSEGEPAWMQKVKSWFGKGSNS